jgi:hypothetical protein
MEDKKTPFSQVHVMLSPEHLALVEKARAKPTSRVRLVVYGTLKGLSMGQDDRSQEGAATGTLEIDASSLKFASNNEIADLFDEEFDG